MEGKGTVYLYRTSAFYAIGQAFDVQVDGKSVGALPNASYLALHLPPGQHVLTVAPGSIGRSSARGITVQAGHDSYYQYDFVTGPLANYLFIGSDIEPREPGVALQELRALNGAAVPEVLDLDLPGLYARLDDVQAVPGLNERGREGYRQWLNQRRPRAFVLGSNGAWNSSWGRRAPGPGEPPDPVERALYKCEQRGAGPCRVYAVDDMVVWQH